MSAAAVETNARCGLAPLGCACGAPPGARTAACGVRHGVRDANAHEEVQEGRGDAARARLRRGL